MARLVLALAVLASPATAMVGGKKGQLPELHRKTLATIPMTMFAEDCKINSPANKALIQKAAKNPGAGINPFEPFQKVLKDGFFMVDCVKDSLREFGDKFGNGKHSYNMGDISNVSIVHYTEVVPKEDQEPMSHEVCFAFCRTVPDMGFFGIHNGRDCYCEPYYKAMESDSTECDAVCEGSPTQMCGGKVKSSIFGMHQCADTATQMSEASTKAMTAEGDLSDEISTLESVSSAMQGTAAAIQEIAGKIGDPHSSDLMQSAKVFAGELEHTAEDKTKIADAIKEADGEAKGMKQADLTTFENAEKAEKVTDSLTKLAVDAEDAAEEITELLKLSNPVSEDADGAAEQYYPIMYFVDKEFADVPTTCGGEVVKKPMAMISEDECAHACNANFQECVGYSYYGAGQGGQGGQGQGGQGQAFAQVEKKFGQGLCFMFSSFKEATYYAGCAQDKQMFLQKKQGGLPEICKAKLSKFEGTTLKPDGSGKCKQCLKEAKKADRCPPFP